MLQKYGLCIDKELVKIEALSKTEGDSLQSGLVAHWMISKIEIPANLIKKGYVEEDIVYMIEQAFTALGLSGVDRKNIADVLVEITASPEIMKEESKKEEREVSLKKKDDLFMFRCGFCLFIIAIVVFSDKVAVALDISGRTAAYLILLVVVFGLSLLDY